MQTETEGIWGIWSLSFAAPFSSQEAKCISGTKPTRCAPCLASSRVLCDSLQTQEWGFLGLAP